MAQGSSNLYLQANDVIKICLFSFLRDFLYYQPLHNASWLFMATHLNVCTSSLRSAEISGTVSFISLKTPGRLKEAK